jgi:hypothetical protein
MTLSEIVRQLASCEYECEAGNLRMNVAFIALVERARAECCPNWGDNKENRWGPCYECAWCELFSSGGTWWENMPGVLNHRDLPELPKVQP